MNSPTCILEDSNFDFRSVRLSDLDISRAKWLNYLQTVETLIRHCVPWVVRDYSTCSSRGRGHIIRLLDRCEG